MRNMLHHEADLIHVAGRKVAPEAIESVLGEGGMGVVYIATNERLQKRVALKVLSESVASDPEAAVRFTREAISASRVQHPGVVEIAAVDDGTIRIVAHLPAVAGLIDEVARCRRLLGLDQASAALVGTWTEFEGAIRGLVAAVEPDRAGDVLADLADRYGTPIRGVAELGLTRLFPVAAQLCSVADLPVGDGRLASRIRELATAAWRS